MANKIGKALTSSDVFNLESFKDLCQDLNIDTSQSIQNMSIHLEKGGFTEVGIKFPPTKKEQL